MTRGNRRFRLGLVAGVALAAATALAAGSLPNLPKDTVLPQAGDSPGPVTFSHETHARLGERPDCTTCHPASFSILAGAGTDSGIRHEAMEAGRQCGACHDGQKAFGLDDCQLCHLME